MLWLSIWRALMVVSLSVLNSVFLPECAKEPYLSSKASNLSRPWKTTRKLRKVFNRGISKINNAINAVLDYLIDTSADPPDYPTRIIDLRECNKKVSEKIKKTLGISNEVYCYIILMTTREPIQGIQKNNNTYSSSLDSKDNIASLSERSTSVGSDSDLSV